MSEHTDATEDRPEDDELDRAGANRDEPDETERAADEPQPWAKALPGDSD